MKKLLNSIFHFAKISSISIICGFLPLDNFYFIPSIDTIINFQFIFFHVLNIVSEIPFSSENEFKE